LDELQNPDSTRDLGQVIKNNQVQYVDNFSEEIEINGIGPYVKYGGRSSKFMWAPVYCCTQ
jgi:hypothetical protein